MSKSSSEATEKPGTGILRMARVNSNLYVNRENIWKTCKFAGKFYILISEIKAILE